MEGNGNNEKGFFIYLYVFHILINIPRWFAFWHFDESGKIKLKELVTKWNFHFWNYKSGSKIQNSNEIWSLNSCLFHVVVKIWYQILTATYMDKASVCNEMSDVKKHNQ